MQEPEEIEQQQDVTGDVQPEDPSPGSEPEEIAQASEEDVEVDTHPVPDKTNLQQRFDKLSQQRRKAEADAAYWRGVAEGKTTTPGASGTTEPPAAKPMPRRDDYEDDFDYFSDLTDWKVEQKLQNYHRETEKVAEERRLAESYAEFDQKLAEGAIKYEDFDEVVRDPTLKITAGMLDIIRDCENPADIAYYLGKNRKETTMIAGMSERQATLAIGRIEASLMASQNKIVPKKASDAPPPIKPIGGGETGSKDPEKMSNEEYRRWRMGG